MTPYSLYIGPAGPFSIFPSSRLKRRPSHCELELAEGECEFVSACVHICPIPFLRGERCQCTDTHTTARTGSVLMFYSCATGHPNKLPRPGNHSMAQGPQNGSSTRTHSHPGSSHMTTIMQETAMGPQPHTQDTANRSHLGPWPHKNQPHHHSHA